MSAGFYVLMYFVPGLIFGAFVAAFILETKVPAPRDRARYDPVWKTPEGAYVFGGVAFVMWPLVAAAIVLIFLTHLMRKFVRRVFGDDGE